MSKKDENMGFPEKLMKKLPTGWAQTAEGLSAEELEKLIIECENNINEVEKEKNADEKYLACKSLLKDLSAGYRDATQTQTAKIKYALYLLESMGKI